MILYPRDDSNLNSTTNNGKDSLGMLFNSVVQFLPNVALMECCQAKPTNQQNDYAICASLLHLNLLVSGT